MDNGLIRIEDNEVDGNKIEENYSDTSALMKLAEVACNSTVTGTSLNYIASDIGENESSEDDAMPIDDSEMEATCDNDCNDIVAELTNKKDKDETLQEIGEKVNELQETNKHEKSPTDSIVETKPDGSKNEINPNSLQENNTSDNIVHEMDDNQLEKSEVQGKCSGHFEKDIESEVIDKINHAQDSEMAESIKLDKPIKSITSQNSDLVEIPNKRPLNISDTEIVQTSDDNLDAAEDAIRDNHTVEIKKSLPEENEMKEGADEIMEVDNVIMTKSPASEHIQDEETTDDEGKLQIDYSDAIDDASDDTETCKAATNSNQCATNKGQQEKQKHINDSQTIEDQITSNIETLNEKISNFKNLNDPLICSKNLTKQITTDTSMILNKEISDSNTLNKKMNIENCSDSCETEDSQIKSKTQNGIEKASTNEETSKLLRRSSTSPSLLIIDEDNPSEIVSNKTIVNDGPSVDCERGGNNSESLEGVCKKCRSTWNDYILAKLFSGNQAVTINSRITHGAVACMYNYANLIFKEKPKLSVRALLERADSKGPLNDVMDHDCLMNALKSEVIVCCNYFKQVISKKQSDQLKKRTPVVTKSKPAEELPLVKNQRDLSNSVSSNNDRTVKSILNQKDQDQCLKTLINKERESLHYELRVTYDDHIIDMNFQDYRPLTKLPVRNIDMVNFYSKFKSTGSTAFASADKFFNFVVEVLYLRDVILFIPDGETLITLLKDLDENISTKYGLWDPSNLYCSRSKLSDGEYPRTRDIIQIFCLWKKSEKKPNELKTQIMGLFKINFTIDCLGLCFRLYSRYCELTLKKTFDFAKIELFLNLHYLPQEELDKLKQPTIVSPDLLQIPSCFKDLSECISYLEERLDDTEKKRPLPEVFKEYKYTQAKKLKSMAVNFSKSHLHTELLEEYGTLKTKFETEDKKSIVSDSQILTLDDLKSMYNKLREEQIPIADIPNIIEMVVNMCLD